MSLNTIYVAQHVAHLTSRKHHYCSYITTLQLGNLTLMIQIVFWSVVNKVFRETAFSFTPFYADGGGKLHVCRHTCPEAPVTDARLAMYTNTRSHSSWKLWIKYLSHRLKNKMVWHRISITKPLAYWTASSSTDYWRGSLVFSLFSRAISSQLCFDMKNAHPGCHTNKHLNLKRQQMLKT